MAVFALGAMAVGGALIGDAMASDSQSAANTANAQINAQNNQASMDRQLQAQTYNSAQAAISRDYNTEMTLQAEQYDTQMSDTAMQRRVADLKAAGINPLLAVSQGGASTPTISQGSSAQATSGVGSVPGQIPMQSTGAAYGNLGGQIASALSTAQAGAQIDLLKAQTNKVTAEAGQEIPANVNYLKSMTGLTDQNAAQAYTNTQLIQEKIYGQRLDNDQLRDITTPLNGQRLEVIKATRDALISAQQSDATAKQLQLSGLRNLNDVQQSNLGKILTYLNAILQPVNSGARAARDIAGSIP